MRDIPSFKLIGRLTISLRRFSDSLSWTWLEEECFRCSRKEGIRIFMLEDLEKSGRNMRIIPLKLFDGDRRSDILRASTFGLSVVMIA